MAKLIRLLEYVVTLLMAIVTVSVVAEIFMRTFADTSLIITDELSRYLMVWTALLAAAILVHEDSHVRVTLVEGMLGPRGALAVSILAQSVAFCFFALVIVSSLMMLPTLAEQNTVTLGISIVWFYLALPVSSILMAALTVRNTTERLRRYLARADGGAQT
jgi:TRAP-type C4-dicarboxylate transport system permease small subunit